MQRPRNSEQVRDHVLARMAEQGLTQSELARRVGIAPPTVNKWVHGQTTPDIRLWPVIERALDLPEGDLRRIAELDPLESPEAVASRLDRFERVLLAVAEKLGVEVDPDDLR